MSEEVYPRILYQEGAGTIRPLNEDGHVVHLPVYDEEKGYAAINVTVTRYSEYVVILEVELYSCGEEYLYDRRLLARFVKDFEAQRAGIEALETAIDTYGNLFMSDKEGESNNG